jgi:hypothetical protein
MTGASGASATTGTLTDSTSGAAEGAGESGVESTWGTTTGAAGAGVSIGERSAGASAVGAASGALSVSGASTTISGAELLRRFGVLPAADPPGTPARGDTDSPSPASGAELAPVAVSEAAPDPRAPPRVAADREPARDAVDFDAESDADAESADEPAEPVVSANATGIAATAEPTPNATANAPTRPTYDAVLTPADSDEPTARRRYSIACTRPLDERR